MFSENAVQKAIENLVQDLAELENAARRDIDSAQQDLAELENAARRDIELAQLDLAEFFGIPGATFRCSRCRSIATAEEGKDTLGQQMASVWKYQNGWFASRSVPHDRSLGKAFGPRLPLDIDAIPRQLIAMSCRRNHNYSVPSAWLVKQTASGSRWDSNLVPRRFFRADPAAVPLP